MTESDLQELDRLLERLCNERLDDDQLAADRLIELLEISEACRLRYLDTMELHATLWRMGTDQGGALPAVDAPAAEPVFVDPDRTASFGGDSTLVSFLSTTFQAAVSYFSSDTRVAILAATLLTTIGLLVATLVHVSQPVQTAENRSRAVSPVPEIVGRITGMSDCRWAKDCDCLSKNGVVRLGREFKLESGLLEIGYDTGATVLLQGPVTYTVESSNGGFLAIGKLTGKVVAASARGFAVWTPNALVTDLGTEFGIEVKESGASEVLVFAGEVELSRHGGKESLRLSASGTSAARVEADSQIRPLASPPSTEFARQLPASEPYAERVCALRPVAYWSFDHDRDGTIRDASGNGHNGILRGGATTVTKGGRHAGGLQLNGVDGFVEIPSYPELRPRRSSFTIAGWMRVDSRSGAHHLMGQGAPEPPDKGVWREVFWSVRLFETTGELRAGMRLAADSTSTFWTAPTGDLRDGRWHHLAVVFDRQRDEQLYYVNGTRIATKDNRRTLRPDDSLDSPLTIKIGTDGGFGYTLGVLDDVVMFTRALTAEEIDELYR